MSSGTWCHGLRRPGDEFHVDEPPSSASHAELRAIRDRPLGAEVEGSAPTSFIDRKELYPHFDVASGAVGSHSPFTLPFAGSAVKTCHAGTRGRASYPPRLKNCTARSCFSAAARVPNVPRLRRFPVFGSFLRE